MQADAGGAPPATDPSGEEEGEELPPPPRLEDFQYELHGQLHGDPFWMRLEAKRPELGELRLLHLQYAVPEPAELGGAILIDHPLLAVTDQLYIGGWKDENAKSLASAFYFPDEGLYKVTRETERVVGEDVFPDSELVEIASAPAWDLRLAPLFLALAWQQHGSGRVHVVDLFAGQEVHAGELSWQGERATIFDRTWTLVADEQGRLAKIVEDGETILVVEGRLEPLTAAEAAARRQRIESTGSPD